MREGSTRMFEESHIAIIEMFFFTDMVVFPERLLRLYPKIASLKLVGGPWFMELSSKTGRLRIGSYSTMRSTTLMFMGKRIAPRR